MRVRLSPDHRRYLAEHLSVLFLVAALSVLLSISGALSFVDRYIYDNLLHTLPDEPASDLVIVGIDEYSLREVGRWPWDRKVHADIINRLTEMGARAVLMDLILSEPDRNNPQSDLALVQAMAANGHVYLPVHVEQLRAGGQLIEVLPYSPFARAAAGLGHVDLELDADGVARSVFMRSGIGQAWWPHITQTLLVQEGMLSEQLFPADKGEEFSGLANVRRYHRLIPFVNGPNSYPQVSAVELLENLIPEQLIRDKIVLIGATAAGLGDMLPTPMGNSGELMAGVEINANLLDALREDRLIRDLGKPSALVLGALLALLAPLLLPFVLPRWSIPLVAGIMGACLLVSMVLLITLRLWFPPAPAMVAALMAYPLWTWRRLEYSLSYMRNALERLSGYSDLNQRLTRASSLQQMANMLDTVMPVKAWRLQGGDAPLRGGDRLPASGWKGALARQYRFRHEGKRYELDVVWKQALDADTYDYWVRAMLVRVRSHQPLAGPRYEVLENHIERLQREEERQEALTRFFQVTLAQIREGVVIADACGVIVYANPQAALLLGIDMGTLDSGQSLVTDLGRELELRERSWDVLLRQTLAEGRSQLECRNRQGADLYLDMLLVHAGDNPGRMMILSFKDISEVKQALRARSEMLDFLSHDLRSPMVSVLALTEKMREDSNPDLPAFLDNVQHYAQRNLSIAEQFLQLARVEAVETVELNEQDMLDVVESAIDLVQIQAHQRGIALRFDYDPEQDVWVLGNNELLERLVVNLLTNAIKYSHEGSSVDVRLFADGNEVCCEVRDRGVGIPEEFQSQLFQRFSRASTSGGARTRGAGMGLRFVKVVTERHGGDIQVQSQVNQGSRFLLRLPRVEL
ncbi:MAG: ATPase [Alcanivoracaceae bacterium]|uniref:CHASE2 domain-containing protein n=1 Tax=Alcanivorax sp. MD8A TaxID=1177157 RepID=UPI000C3DD5BA|nr:CHASE2 domain-containing protein [Alcanivorax sp. MD8A]MAX54819.1 ATPase [Alcanivoracaceae bacterium]MEE2869210.1 CHASE2 domain-containing protein [Pseudomonadota bacterium]PNE04214.1 sensory box histidine kinase PhoR [Alcanivorax sp. MD8A]|tara:strand:+ start:5916 stop:8504 length:2589 start_codon:yes stop_codon:yes gene_type:complete